MREGNKADFTQSAVLVALPNSPSRVSESDADRDRCLRPGVEWCRKPPGGLRRQHPNLPSGVVGREEYLHVPYRLVAAVVDLRSDPGDFYWLCPPGHDAAGLPAMLGLVTVSVPLGFALTPAKTPMRRSRPRSVLTLWLPPRSRSAHPRSPSSNRGGPHQPRRTTRGCCQTQFVTRRSSGHPHYLVSRTRTRR